MSSFTLMHTLLFDTNCSIQEHH
uniref:Uncharacterized protein n=1 Tax=Arundo donax TaxID=35708 RepID=A0A0A8YJA1_ARUDO